MRRRTLHVRRELQVGKHAESGLTLIEVLIAMMILGIALGGILPTVWSAIRRNYEVSERIRARAVATEIHEEIIAMPRANTNERMMAAPDPRTPRAEFRSAFEYDGLTESPPCDPLGNPIADAEGFTRKVTVRHVDPSDPTRETSENTDLVAITIEVLQNGETIRSLRFLRSLR